jgi:hypothetical protein
LLQAWFVLVPPGSRAPRLEYSELADGLNHEIERLRGSVSKTGKDIIEKLMANCRQPALVHQLAAAMTDAASQPENQAEVKGEAMFGMLLVLKAATDAIDKALRG